jgi:hypothetical protein
VERGWIYLERRDVIDWQSSSSVKDDASKPLHRVGGRLQSRNYFLSVF